MTCAICKTEGRHGQMVQYGVAVCAHAEGASRLSDCAIEANRRRLASFRPDGFDARVDAAAKAICALRRKRIGGQ